MSRRSVRYAAAFIAAAMATIYVLIGLDVLQVIEDQLEGTDLFGFGMSAAALFAFGALLLVAFDRRSLWALGAILQVAVVVLYVAVSVNRHPPFEFWGVALRLLQVPLFLALVVLAVQPRTDASVVASRPRIGRG